jgi:hypothetical protein
MRLWKALHTSFRGKSGARRAGRPRARLEVESLDQRLLPSTVPNLSGVVMHFVDAVSGYVSDPTSLTIQSVQDLGGGKGTFVGVYQDTLDGVTTGVSGTITLKGMANTWIGNTYGPSFDFGLTFSGSATHVQWNPHTGIWSRTVERASGSGDFYTNAVSGNASIYQAVYWLLPAATQPAPPGSWVYSGQVSDSLSYSSPSGGYTLSESVPVEATNIAYMTG